MKEKIVFLDSATVDYGDIDFSSLKELGEFRAYEFTEPGQVIQRSRDANLIITNKVIIDSKVIDECKSLKLIAVAATGYNNIDIDSALEKGIPVANVPGYSTFSVAQLTIAFILALATNIVQYNTACHDGTWSNSRIFTLGKWPSFDLSNKVLGILGMGTIGRKVAGLAEAFNMQVITLKRADVYYDDGFERYDLHSLAEASDFITVHLPLTPYSKYLIDKEFFERMKKTAFFINMARGPIVKSDALAWALKTSIIAGAAIDVMEKEPPGIDEPLLKSPNLIITPHIAWASIESRKKLISEITENIKAYINNTRRNIVNSFLFDN